MKKVTFFSTVLLIMLAHNSFSQAGNLDNSFGMNGKVITSLSSYCQANEIVLQPDGKIVAVGSSSDSFAIVRYNPNGSLDTVFGANGKLIVAPISGIISPKGFFSVAIQEDGKIIASGGGDATGFLMRFNGNGSLDSTFGTNGTVIWYVGVGSSTHINSLLLEPDGKVVAAGFSINDLGIISNQIILARFNTDGSFDSTFISGIPTDKAAAYSAAFQSDGKIVLAGIIDSGSLYVSHYGVFRYNSNGAPDSSFGINGMVTITVGAGYGRFNSVAIQGDNRIVSAGYLVDTSFHHFFMLMCFKNDGLLDGTFSQDGILTTSIGGGNSEANSVVVQSDSEILVGGNSDNGFTLVRYNIDGSLDNSFGGDGIVTIGFGNSANSIVMQPDGKILAAGGNGGFFLARYLSGLNVGVLNLSSYNLPVLIYPNPIQSEATLQYTLSNNECITISLYNMQGSMVQNFISEEARNQGEHKEVLELDAALPAGEYILSISNGTHRQGIRIVKQ